MHCGVMHGNEKPCSAKPAVWNEIYSRVRENPEEDRAGEGEGEGKRERMMMIMMMMLIMVMLISSASGAPGSST